MRPVKPYTKMGLNCLANGAQSRLCYPVLRGIPLLRGEHSIVASKIID